MGAVAAGGAWRGPSGAEGVNRGRVGSSDSRGWPGTRSGKLWGPDRATPLTQGRSRPRAASETGWLGGGDAPHRRLRAPHPAAARTGGSWPDAHLPLLWGARGRHGRRDWAGAQGDVWWRGGALWVGVAWARLGTKDCPACNRGLPHPQKTTECSFLFRETVPGHTSGPRSPGPRPGPPCLPSTESPRHEQGLEDQPPPPPSAPKATAGATPGREESAIRSLGPTSHHRPGGPGAPTPTPQPAFPGGLGPGGSTGRPSRGCALRAQAGPNPFLSGPTHPSSLLDLSFRGCAASSSPADGAHFRTPDPGVRAGAFGCPAGVRPAPRGVGGAQLATPPSPRAASPVPAGALLPLPVCDPASVVAENEAGPEGHRLPTLDVFQNPFLC